MRQLQKFMEVKNKMSNAMLNIYVRTFKRRMDAGETFDDILANYPKLSSQEADQIRLAIDNL